MELSQATQIVSKGLSEIRVPLGHILISGRWRSTELAACLQGTSAQVLFDDSLGFVDFYPSSHTGVLYVSESDIVSGVGYKRKVAKLRKSSCMFGYTKTDGWHCNCKRANRVRGVVIAEKTTTSAQYYPDLQTFCMLEIGFVLLPVATQTEAAGLLSQMVDVESKSEPNPFLKKPRTPSFEISLLTTLQCVPRLGDVKARQLLQHFKSLQAIAGASNEDLARVVGKASANTVKAFLDSS